MSRLTPQETWLQALADVQHALERQHALARDIHSVLEPHATPAQQHFVHLSTTKATSGAAAVHGSRSFSVLNPNAIVVYLGVGAVSADNVSGVPVPPRSGLTLPVSAENLEVGLTVGDLQAAGATDAYLWVYTYDSVRPFSLGGWPG